MAQFICNMLCELLQEGQLSYEEAIIARQSHFRETREKVIAIKEEVCLFTVGLVADPEQKGLQAVLQLSFLQCVCNFMCG